MPQIPVLIPIVITGLLVGSMMRNKGRGVSKKKLGFASLLSGLLNGGQAYLTYLLTPQPTFVRTGVTVPAAVSVRQTSELAFTISSILTGALILLAVVGIAMLYVRFRKGEEEEVEVEALTSEK